MSEWITNELNQQMADYRWANQQIVVSNRIVKLEQCDGEMHEDNDAKESRMIENELQN